MCTLATPGCRRSVTSWCDQVTPASAPCRPSRAPQRCYTFRPDMGKSRQDGQGQCACLLPANEVILLRQVAWYDIIRLHFGILHDCIESSVDDDRPSLGVFDGGSGRVSGQQLRAWWRLTRVKKAQLSISGSLPLPYSQHSMCQNHGMAPAGWTGCRDSVLVAKTEFFKWPMQGQISLILSLQCQLHDEAIHKTSRGYVSALRAS